MTAKIRLVATLIGREPLLAALIALLLAMATVSPASIALFPAMVEWPTIAALAGLLMLTKGIESSGYLETVTRALLSRIHTQRALALVLVGVAALLSTVLTNDIALFIVVPLTVALRHVERLPVGRLIVFEALAVNAGSALTPIGNPQNLFLWQVSGVSFVDFTTTMLPLVAVCGAALVLLTAVAFRSTRLRADTQGGASRRHPRALAASLLLYVPFIAAADSRHAIAGFAVLLTIYALALRRVLAQIDWALLAVFVLMFVDLRLVADLPITHALLEHIDLSLPPRLFITGVIGSQLISNVPTVILLQRYSEHWQVLSYAVNVGGFGLALGSLANIIALRLARDRRIWLTFHVYSVPFLLFAGGIVYVGLFQLHLAAGLFR